VVDPAIECKAIVDFLYENLTKKSDHRRFHWLYMGNPCGKARVWFACEENCADVLGIAAAFPRSVRVQGKDIIGWNLGDFVIRRDFRSLGPALSLQRACLAPVLEGEIPFSYDHPSKGMLAVYKRMGISETSKVIRFVKPITVDRYVQKYLRGGLASRGISKVGNTVLGIKEWRGRNAPDLNIQVQPGRFNDEFTVLNDLYSGSHLVCGQRTAEYLNWRYLDNPLQDFEVVTVRRKSELVAYGVLTKNEEDVTLYDIFGDTSRPVINALLLFVSDLLRQRKVYSISTPVIATSFLAESLRTCGFFPRESADVVFCTKQGGTFDGIVNREENWFLNCGDRDI
jgi:hypothetical protein